VPVNGIFAPAVLFTGLGLGIAAALEISACWFPENWSGLVVTAWIRTLQVVALSILAAVFPGARRDAGLDPGSLTAGVRTGIAVSVLFGACASIVGTVLYLLGVNPLAWVVFPIRHDGFDLALFFLTGCILSPVAEELVFRSLLFRALRPLGTLPAAGLNALVFALFHHQGQGLPLVPFIGGVVFAVSFERSGHIVTPVIIHCLGNLALFSLALL
jgi:membrane protease YdiL (CAAX protease family)